MRTWSQTKNNDYDENETMTVDVEYLLSSFCF